MLNAKDYGIIRVMTDRLVIAQIKQRTGSLTVSVEGAILVAEFTGACTLKIAEFFHQAILDAIPHLPNDGWCYLSSSKDYVAALPEVEAIYTRTYKLCMHSGCVAEAYCMPSVVGLAQVDKSRKACGVESSIESIAFNSLEEAKGFLLSTLAKIKEKRNAKA